MAVTLDQLLADAQAISGQSPKIKQFALDLVTYLQQQVPPPPPPPPAPVAWAWDATAATLSANSPTLVSRVSAPAANGAFFAASVAWVNAPAGTPGYSIQHPSYSPLDSSLPIPVGTKPGATQDHHLFVIDSTGREHDLWSATYDPTTQKITAAGGGASFPSSNVTAPLNVGANAASFPLSRALITPDDLKAGAINHPLVMSMPLTAANGNPGVFPANTSWNDPTVPYGQWYRLDPAVNCDTLGLDTLTLLIARALQKYGAFVRDESGVGNNTIAVYGRDMVNQGGNGSAYPVPLTWNPINGYPTFAKLGAIPWDRLQALNPPSQ